jgi:hypothetical protein
MGPLKDEDDSSSPKDNNMKQMPNNIDRRNWDARASWRYSIDYAALFALQMW